MTSQFETLTWAEKELEIRPKGVKQLLDQLQVLTAARVRDNKELLEKISRCFGDEERGAIFVESHFFDTMSSYFDRTLRENSRRTITLCDLRTELQVYLWTSFSDFLWKHCSFQISVSRLDACDER